MHPIYNYDLYIFDCDGVILDSNALKVQAMREALSALPFTPELIAECVDYFANNFGKSRFHHVAHFLEYILNVEEIDRVYVEQKLLADFSNQCRTLYLTAELTPNFLEFIESLPGRKYVASGSEQSELREVFKNRGLDLHFIKVYGSPTKKSDLIKKIISKESNATAVMIGDAVSDFEASKSNNIDFYCYIPYSNVVERMQMLSEDNNFEVLEQWPIIINNTKV
ncbi:Haloacid dehalogenase-like hydrolase [Shewanella denitrificans OS217]|uniref:phosphoglycolate phosphatase n=1 Tax=Shewanella denitrificans (strain OS217 / ATCC BAA-1090 / DSM 15013) TaxID=318161 RepID=Q12KT0_SHEDO|nr:HAD-IA family hydrolase [Shewanella denitrificans]ABE55946.1 Haloacid dehalogenase-like hydrolase [Shewanella denitrificans OS217]